MLLHNSACQLGVFVVLANPEPDEILAEPDRHGAMIAPYAYRPIAAYGFQMRGTGSGACRSSEAGQSQHDLGGGAGMPCRSVGHGHRAAMQSWRADGDALPSGASDAAPFVDLERSRPLRRRFRAETVTDLGMRGLITAGEWLIIVGFPDEPATGADMEWISANPNDGKILRILLPEPRSFGSALARDWPPDTAIRHARETAGRSLPFSIDCRLTDPAFQRCGGRRHGGLRWMARRIFHPAKSELHCASV